MAKTRKRAKELLAQADIHARKLREIACWFSGVYDGYAEIGGMGSVIDQQMALLQEVLQRMRNRL